MFVEYFSFSLAHRIVAQALQYSFMEIKYNISIHRAYVTTGSTIAVKLHAMHLASRDRP